MTTKIITPSGNVTQTTAVQDPFGTNQPVSYFDGTGDYLLITDASDLNLTTGNFTVECRIRGTYSAGGDKEIFWFGGNGSSSFCTVRLVIINRNLSFLASSDNYSWNPDYRSIATLSDNTWYHIALIRYNGIFYVSVNGTIVYTNSSFTSTTFYRGTINAIGAISWVGYSGFGQFYTGYMSEFRVSNVARYTTNFTVRPTRFFTDSNTVLLLHMCGTGNTFVDSSVTDLPSMIRSGYEWL